MVLLDLPSVTALELVPLKDSIYLVSYFTKMVNMLKKIKQINIVDLTRLGKQSN